MALYESTEKTSGEPKFRVVLVAPTYNNATTLLGVLDRIVAIGLPLIVVNDGATDETAHLLESWVKKRHDNDVCVITHAQNQGKAAAMRTGFAHAQKKGFTHAVTIDTDGQLEPKEIPQLIEAAKACPTALVLGRRSERTPGLPKSSLTGWHTSGLGLWLETGMIFRDSQCGLRAYPLVLFDVVHCRVGRFGFEAEIIARAVWAGFPIVETPVSCQYPTKTEDRVTHMRPWRDGCKGVLMHWALAIRRLIPWPTPKLTTSSVITSNMNKSTMITPAVTAPRKSLVCGVASRETVMPQLASHSDDAEDFRVIEQPNNAMLWRRWLDPLGIVRQIRSSRMEQWIAGAAVGHGAFMACMPLGLWAFVVVIFGSKRLHHNLWAALFGACLTLPPIGPFLAKLAITIAYLPTHFAMPDFTGAMPGVDSIAVVLRAFPIAWPIGGIIIGFACHWLAIFAVVRSFRNLTCRNDIA